MHYLMVLLCILNMGVNFQIVAHEVICMVYNRRKPVNFYDIVYYLQVNFLQHVFKALNNIFKYSKPREQTVLRNFIFVQIK
jgi:hypothetical protein